MGSLHVITGPMFSGKTEELIRRVRRAKDAELTVQVFVHTLDRRHGEGHVVSHGGNDLAKHGLGVWTVSSDDLPKLATRVRDVTNVVAIDEAQFFDGELIAQVRTLLARDLTVYAAGLDRDYRDEPFGPMPQLLALADTVTKLTAVCAICKRDEARMTYRRTDDTIQIVIGAAEKYAPMCRPCYTQATSTGRAA